MRCVWVCNFYLLAFNLDVVAILNQHKKSFICFFDINIEYKGFAFATNIQKNLEIVGGYRMQKYYTSFSLYSGMSTGPPLENFCILTNNNLT